MSVHPTPGRIANPTLQLSMDGDLGVSYPLRSVRTVLGRAAHCDVSLPGDRVSRVHCFIEHRDDHWWLVNRSRNGTTLNGQSIEQRARLAHGDLIDIAGFRVAFCTEDSLDRAAPTAIHRVRAALHEEPVSVDAAGLTSRRVTLRDKHSEECWEVHNARNWVGGSEGELPVGRGLPARSCMLRVSRGRAMVEPGQAPCFVAEMRVRDTTPIYPGETLRIGAHEFIVETRLATRARDTSRLGGMVGEHPSMRRLFGTLRRVAAHDPPVLLIGESGTGKELAAKAVHDTGPRAEGPWVALNVAAISETLFESELFGHEKGAFTGAVSRQDGAFHRAHGGTLFLDEIGELPLAMQAKLLRTLESGEVRRVGGAKVEYPDVRIVAATNRDLCEMVEAGTFRQDLYFRLSQLPIELPALRQRPSDVVTIAEELLASMAPGASLSTSAQEALTAHSWPGNVRELRNVLQRAVILHGLTIHSSHLQFEQLGRSVASAAAPGVHDFSAAERHNLLNAMHEAAGNKAAAARILGVPRSTLTYKLQKHGIC